MKDTRADAGDTFGLSVCGGSRLIFFSHDKKSVWDPLYRQSVSFQLNANLEIARQELKGALF